ncbi:MAG: translesion error-prone DNA polymerase V autoproteolytic subunit [Muribaculum sp.]|nr:translesion error-prone DNA polymerase V autoproteolytic subunit [Muribaculum sp.]
METKDVRLTLYSPDDSTELSLPYAEGGVRAGFPSPAQEYVNERIDLNKALIPHPAATFFAKVEGLSMVEEGIDEGDIIIVDRSIDPEDGDLAVCCIDGDFTLKRIKAQRGKIFLMPSNHKFRPIEITEDNEFKVWGIVIHTIKTNRRLRRRL